MIVVAILLACIGPFFIKGPSGEPLLTIDDFLSDLPDSPADLLPDALVSEGSEAEGEITQIYKWKDENGVWQFSNSPVDANGAELMEIDSNINTIPAFKAPEKTGSVATKKKTPSIPGVMTVSPGQAAELMDTVNNLQETIDQRKSEMDKVTGMEGKR